MTENSIVSIIGLNKWYGDFHVLRDIDLDVAKGERIVICGPSGSGKSTLIRCINALEEFQEGQIVVDGIELGPNLRRVDEVRREVGMVFQSFNLFPHLTVLENCTLAPIWVRNIPKKDAEAAAMKYLERVKIPHQANKFPGQMSGGQQQRVAIARALTMNPKSCCSMSRPRRWIPKWSREVLDTMVDLANEGMTMLVVTHEWDLPGKWRTASSSWTPGKLSKPTRRRTSSPIRSTRGPSCFSAKSCGSHSCKSE